MGVVGKTLCRTRGYGRIFRVRFTRREYEIEVTDEAISMRGGLQSAVHKVRRGHIQFVRELSGNIFREPALRLSEHGSILRFLFGHVWLPQSIPQYEEIKNKAMSWMDIG